MVSSLSRMYCGLSQMRSINIHVLLLQLLLYLSRASPVSTNISSNLLCTSSSNSSVNFPDAQCVDFSLRDQDFNPSPRTFEMDCMDAWTRLLSKPPFAQSRWYWRRFPVGGSVPPGYAALPLSKSYGLCMLKLDLWSTGSDDTDQLALIDLAIPFRTLLEECVEPKEGKRAAGYIKVGAHSRLKFALGPAIRMFPGNDTITYLH